MSHKGFSVFRRNQGAVLKSAWIAPEPFSNKFVQSNKFSGRIFRICEQGKETGAKRLQSSVFLSYLKCTKRFDSGSTEPVDTAQAPQRQYGQDSIAGKRKGGLWKNNIDQ